MRPDLINQWVKSTQCPQLHDKLTHWINSPAVINLEQKFSTLSEEEKEKAVEVLVRRMLVQEFIQELAKTIQNM